MSLTSKSVKAEQYIEYIDHLVTSLHDSPLVTQMQHIRMLMSWTLGRRNYAEGAKPVLHMSELFLQLFLRGPSDAMTVFPHGARSMYGMHAQVYPRG